jgi:hypothetical protein
MLAERGLTLVSAETLTGRSVARREVAAGSRHRSEEDAMTWFRKSEMPHPADPARAKALLDEAQALRARGELARAQSVAKAALDEGVQVHGERHPALVPFLLVYAGLLHQVMGWASGRPFYEKAQRLRAAAHGGAGATSS